MLRQDRCHHDGDDHDQGERMNFPPQQEQALHTVGRWMRDPKAPQVLYMAGYAGTGKTTLAKHLVSSATRRWLFAALTGKATHVLRQKGCEDARTIHSLIYRPNGESKASDIRQLEAKLMELREQVSEDQSVEDPVREQIAQVQAQLRRLHEEREPMFALWANSPLADFDVEGVVIDECSMVDDRLGIDLESFGKKILVLGDPAQLPPVGAGGRYTTRKPDVMLTEIHRQAKESGILRLATAVREDGYIDEWDSDLDCKVLHMKDLTKEQIAGHVLWADQVLVGKNATRRTFNVRHRELLGLRSPTPQTGDRLVCLRNNRLLGIYNGSQWKVARADSDISARVTDLTVLSEDDDREVICSSWLHHMIGAEQELTSMGWDRRDLEEFDYSYALTVHKSQGSQWQNVTLFDESRSFGRDVGRRWLYTGITRAAKNLTVML